MNEVHWSSRAEEQDRRGSKRGSEGDKVILTKRGKPFAAVARLREEKIGRLILEGRGWFKLFESAFDFWDNEKDEIWNKA